MTTPQDSTAQDSTAHHSETQGSENATEALPDKVAEVVMSHSQVVRLDSGPLGMITTHLPGRQIIGVLAPETGQTWEVAVILRLDRPLPEIVAELRERIREVAGPVTIDITVSDVSLAHQG